MTEYNPQNELVKKQYEEALLHGKYRDPKTVKAVWNNINLYERFTGYADFKTFNSEQAKSFKMWLEKQTNKDAHSLLKNRRSQFLPCGPAPIDAEVLPGHIFRGIGTK